MMRSSRPSAVAAARTSHARAPHANNCAHATRASAIANRGNTHNIDCIGGVRFAMIIALTA
eukprot:8766770-Lingulodinium_polyedra.AAC.1